MSQTLRILRLAITTALALCLIASPSFAQTLDIRTSPTLLTYNGNGNYTSEFSIRIDVSDTNVLFYAMDLDYDTAELELDDETMNRGSFYTISSASGDSFFVRLYDGDASGTATLMGCRMIAEDDNKGVEGTDIPLYLNIRFRGRVDSPSRGVRLTSFDFRDADGRQIIPSEEFVDLLFSMPGVARFLLTANPRTGIEVGDQFLLSVTALDENDQPIDYDGPVNLSSPDAAFSLAQLILANGQGSGNVGLSAITGDTVFTLTVTDPTDPTATGTLKFNATDLSVHVTAEARAVDNHGNIEVTLVKVNGSETVVARAGLTTNAGEVVFTNLPDGTYYILAEDTSALDRVLTGIIINGGTPEIFNQVLETLIMGDINADNMINDFDRSQMQSLFVQFNGQGTTVESFAADLNRDGVIDMSDWNLSSENFGRGGDVPPNLGGALPLQ